MFHFRLSTFKFPTSVSDFLIPDFGNSISEFAVCFSYYRILSFRLLASDFRFPFSTFGHSISEFGVYFQPLTYNFLSSGFGLLIYDVLLLCLHPSLWRRTFAIPQFHSSITTWIPSTCILYLLCYNFDSVEPFQRPLTQKVLLFFSQENKIKVWGHVSGTQ